MAETESDYVCWRAYHIEKKNRLLHMLFLKAFLPRSSGIYHEF